MYEMYHMTPNCLKVNESFTVKGLPFSSKCVQRKEQHWLCKCVMTAISVSTYSYIFSLWIGLHLACWFLHEIKSVTRLKCSLWKALLNTSCVCFQLQREKQSLPLQILVTAIMSKVSSTTKELHMKAFFSSEFNLITQLIDFTIAGMISLPYAEIKEPFEAWLDLAAKSSRIDYYHGKKPLDPWWFLLNLTLYFLCLVGLIMWNWEPVVSDQSDQTGTFNHSGYKQRSEKERASAFRGIYSV